MALVWHRTEEKVWHASLFELDSSGLVDLDTVTHNRVCSNLW